MDRRNPKDKIRGSPECSRSRTHTARSSGVSSPGSILRHPAISRSFDATTRRKPIVGLNLGNACPENSCHQSKCHQLVKSAADGTAIFPPAELGARRPSRSPRLVHPAAGRMPDRTNRILVTAAGVTHRSQLAYWLRDGGCIGRLQKENSIRRSGEMHRPQLMAALGAVTMMALGSAWRPAHGRVCDR